VLHAQAAGGAISLSHPRLADFEGWAALRRANAEYLRPWEPGFSTRGLNRTANRARLGRLKKLVQQDRAYPFHIFRETPRTLIGACNITHIDRGVSQSARLGYWIGEAHTRRGHARAAVEVAVRFCFEQLGLHRVEAAVSAQNVASIRVLEACNFQREGTARGYLKIGDHWEDHEIYARLNAD
jgi:ribosomal-protein-alanine N-acetyltransferase